MTSHPQRRHISVFRRNYDNILKYIKLQNIANTIERFREKINNARSEAGFAYRRETDSNTHIKILKFSDRSQIESCSGIERFPAGNTRI